MPLPTRDLAGVRFGRLVARQRRGWVAEAARRVPAWSCECDCGRVKRASAKSLLARSTRSCGCLLFERPGRVEVIGPKGDRHKSVLAAARAAGCSARTIERRLADPASGWRRA